MKKLSNKGQAEIMDGLILMIIAAVCSTVLLTTSSNYGAIPLQIYEETYANKLAQNTLLSLYHITELDDATSPVYKKSIMVAVSQDLADSADSLEDETKELIGNVLQSYSDELGWEFVFAILSGEVNMVSGLTISTDDSVIDSASFKEVAGAPYCASAALTYQGSCPGHEAGNMCYAIFEVCVWQP